MLASRSAFTEYDGIDIGAFHSYFSIPHGVGCSVRRWLVAVNAPIGRTDNRIGWNVARTMRAPSWVSCQVYALRRRYRWLDGYTALYSAQKRL